MTIEDLRIAISNFCAEKGVGTITPRRVGTLMGNILTFLNTKIETTAGSGGGSSAPAVVEEDVTANVECGAIKPGDTVEEDTTLTELVQQMLVSDNPQQLTLLMSIDFTYYSTARYINTERQKITAVKLINTGEAKLWVDGVVVLTVPAQEQTDSGTMYTYTLPTSYTIEAGHEVWWTIARDADNLTTRILSIY